MGQGAHHTNWADVPAEAIYPGISRQVVQGQRQTLVRYIYEPGAVFPLHSHPQEQVTLILSGQIEFEVAEGRFTYGPGDVVIIPENAPHGARVVGGVTVETINSLSPRRDTAPGPSN